MSERSARNSYPFRTAPRLPVAEHRVSSSMKTRLTITRTAFAAHVRIRNPDTDFPYLAQGMQLLEQTGHRAGTAPVYDGESAAPTVRAWDTRLVSHAWEATALPLSYTRDERGAYAAAPVAASAPRAMVSVEI